MPESPSPFVVSNPFVSRFSQIGKPQVAIDQHNISNVVQYIPVDNESISRIPQPVYRPVVHTKLSQRLYTAPHTEDMSAPRIILVAGATGRQGSAVVRVSSAVLSSSPTSCY